MNEELMITTRIALLKERKTDNRRIIAKLERRLRKIRNNSQTATS